MYLGIIHLDRVQHNNQEDYLGRQVRNSSLRHLHLVLLGNLPKVLPPLGALVALANQLFPILVVFLAKLLAIQLHQVVSLVQLPSNNSKVLLELQILVVLLNNPRHLGARLPLDLPQQQEVLLDLQTQ